jgi:TonB family protein
MKGIGLSIVCAAFLAACASQLTTAERAYKAQDYAQAYQLLTPLAAKGDPVAERELGYMYEFGRGVPQDYGQSLAWFQKAAEAGDMYAQNQMGYYYEHGYGMSKDYAVAFVWYAKAATQGLSYAENNLGYDYLHGHGVPVDHRMAFGWLYKAAQQGNADAEENLGYMYERGLGTSVNMAAGVQWYQAATKRGNYRAQLFMAECYVSGKCGLTPNTTTAQIYFAEAADHQVRNSAEYDRTMKDIVYAHRLYPQAAFDARQTGTVSLSFDCPDRKAEGVTVTQSSGNSLLDDAAKQAVLDSYFPARPPQWHGDTHVDMRVEFGTPTLHGAPAPATVAPPAAATADAPATATSGYTQIAETPVQTLQEWQDAVSKILNSNKVYPEEAVAAHQTGVVRVTFVVPDRTVAAYTIDRSSGYPLLDQAVKRALADCVFPPRVPLLQGFKNFTVDVKFESGGVQLVPAAATAH